MWTVSALLFVYSPDLGLPKYIQPLLLVGGMLLFLINPLRVCLFEARMWFIKIMVSF